MSNQERQDWMGMLFDLCRGGMSREWGQFSMRFVFGLGIAIGEQPLSNES